MTMRKTLRVGWTEGVRERVPIAMATRLELIAAKRLVRFMRRRGHGGAILADESVEQHAEALLGIS